MITLNEIVDLLQSRNFPVNPKELELYKVPRVKLPNDYHLKFYYENGEYKACVTHKTKPPVIWLSIDVHSLTLALDYAEKVSGITPKASIEQALPSVVEPVQQAAVEHGSRDGSIPLVATAMAIAYATVLTSIGIVAIKFKSSDRNITQPQDLPVGR